MISVLKSRSILLFLTLSSLLNSDNFNFAVIFYNRLENMKYYGELFINTKFPNLRWW